MTYKVRRLHDLDGNLVLESMPLDEDHLLPLMHGFHHNAEENLDGSIVRDLRSADSALKKRSIIF